MKKVLKWVAGGLAIAIVLLAVIGLFLDREWEVSRSTEIAAEPAAIHTHIADLRKWGAWSPFDKADPEMTITHDGAATGKGAIRRWKSAKIGNGEMEILEADPKQGVYMHVRMEEYAPIEGQFVYEPTATGTRVTWTDWGETEGVFGGWMAVLMEPMMGDMFAQGLADLKAVVENAGIDPVVR